MHPTLIFFLGMALGLFTGVAAIIVIASAFWDH
jgi:uncharacterized protein involved in exopolysaccharide biosynthesis